MLVVVAILKSLSMLMVFLALYYLSLLFGQLLGVKYQGALHLILSVYCISLMHVSYGAGFLKGILFKVLSLSTKKASLANISR